MNGWMKWNWQGLIHTLVHFPDVNVEARRDVVKPPHHKAQLAPLGLTRIPRSSSQCFLVFWSHSPGLFGDGYYTTGSSFQVWSFLRQGLYRGGSVWILHVPLGCVRPFCLCARWSAQLSLSSWPLLHFLFPSVNTYKDNFPSPINVDPLFLLPFFFFNVQKDAALLYKTPLVISNDFRK